MLEIPHTDNWISVNSISIYIFLEPRIWQYANVTKNPYVFFTESQSILNLSFFGGPQVHKAREGFLTSFLLYNF